MTYTVHVPVGSVVKYSASSPPRLEKVIVEGLLIIAPVSEDVMLSCSSLVVEKGWQLGRDNYSILAHRRETDPQDTMVRCFTKLFRLDHAAKVFCV